MMWGMVARRAASFGALRRVGLPLSAASAMLVVSSERKRPSDCSFSLFGGLSRKEQAEEEERRRRQEELRATYGPLAKLDLNGDGKIDEKDAALAMQMAKDAVTKNESADAALTKIGAQVSDIIATGLPSQLSWGFTSGYCAGFAAKKVGKFVAVFVGGVFCLLQALHYNGYITVDHSKIQDDFNQAFDMNNDGTTDTLDIKAIYNRFYDVISFHAPSGTGFAAGLLLGLRSG